MTDAGLPLGGLVACGVGIAAAVDPRRGVLLKPPLHHQWHGLPLVEELSGRLDCEFVVGQDDHFAALAEYSEIGTAPGASPLVVLAIGKGLGVGLTIDGRTVVGAHGRLGRIAGWPVTTPAPGAPTPPILGDALVSDGLVAAYRSIGGGTSVHDGQSLALAARSGDQAAQRVIDWATGEIAEVIRRICVLTDPERVVLGGGIAAGSFDLLLSGLAEHLGDTAGLLAASVLGSGAVLTGGLLEAERAAGPRVRERITAGEPAARHTPTIA